MKFKDQLGNEVEPTAFPPQRIISLVPSQTELLYDLGLGDRVVGITKFCIHPDEWFRSKPRVGGTKTVHFDKIEALQPDLIIANKEENTEAEIKALMKRYPVWVSDIRNLTDSLQMIHDLGELTAASAKAETIAREIGIGFHQLEMPKAVQGKKVAYFIWNDPMMAAGSNTFIDDMLKRCGMQNVFDESLRYPETSAEKLQSLDPDFILLSSEPFPFGEKHLDAFATICPRAHILLVDGELFSWYGSRLLKSPDYFMKLLSA